MNFSKLALAVAEAFGLILGARTATVATAVNANIRRIEEVDIDTTTQGLGTVPTAAMPYITKVERGDPGGVTHQTVLTCTALPISMADDAGIAQYGGVKVYDFPTGLLMTLGAVVDGALTGYASLIDTFDGDVAIGTVTATTGATLVSTEADIMPSVALSQAVGEVANCDAVSVAAVLTESGARWLDGTATAKSAFLNFVVDDNAAHGAGTATFTGTITLTWINLGDK